jgi:formylglycine-generating enzyme required for sulfatase activity
MRWLWPTVAVTGVVLLTLSGCAGAPDELPPGEQPVVVDGPGVEPLTSDDPVEFTFDARGVAGEIAVVEITAYLAGSDGNGETATPSDSPGEARPERQAVRRWERVPESQSPLRITVPLTGLEDGVPYELQFVLVAADGTRATVAESVRLELALGLPRPVPTVTDLVTLNRRQPLGWQPAPAASDETAPDESGDTSGSPPAVRPDSAVVRLQGGIDGGRDEVVSDAWGPWVPEEPLVDRDAFSRRDVVAWQVRVVSPGGVLGPWSEDGLIRFDPGRAVPQPRAHTGGGEAVVATPGLSWESVASAESFRVEVRAAGGGESTDVATDAPRLRLDPGELETILNGRETRRIQWRVAAVGPEGVETPFSEYFEFRYVPYMGGLETVVPVDAAVTVIMGSDAAAESDEQPAVPMALELPFEMTRYPVTNRVVAALVELEMAAGRMEIADGRVLTVAESPRTLIGLDTLDFGTQFGLEIVDGRLAVRDGYDAHPAVGLTWYGALAVANALSLLEARDPVYEGLSSSPEEIVIHRDRDGYRLPTEAEWAATAAGRRIVAGAEVTLSEERQLSSIDLRGINHLRSGDRWEDPRPPYTRNGGPTSPVGAVGPSSPVGISDLLGNVWEWTEDWYDPQWYRRVTAGTVESPWRGPEEPTPDVYGRVLRTVRGTAWNTPREEVRPGNRGGFAPEATSHSIGVRLVRTLR